MKFRAVIFDMDGVLIDSEIHWNDNSRTFYTSRGILYTKELKARMTGRSMREAVQMMKQEYQLTESAEELIELRVRDTDPIYETVAEKMPGTDELLQRIHATGMKQAIASGSFLYRIEAIVRRFGWESYFDELISTDHVNFVGKPAPDIYTYAAERLRMAPAECVVIEDSVNGVSAAKAAGMSCIAALDPRWSYGDYTAADIVASSLEDPRVHEFIGI